MKAAVKLAAWRAATSLGSSRRFSPERVCEGRSCHGDARALLAVVGRGRLACPDSTSVAARTFKFWKLPVCEGGGIFICLSRGGLFNIKYGVFVCANPVAGKPGSRPATFFWFPAAASPTPSLIARR